MTAPDLEEYLRNAIASYADDHVVAGDWTPEEALERSAAEFAELLPAGLETEGMLLYMAETGDGEVVGLGLAVLEAPARALGLGLRHRDRRRPARQGLWPRAARAPPRQSSGSGGYRRWPSTSSVTTSSLRASTRRPATELMSQQYRKAL